MKIIRMKDASQDSAASEEKKDHHHHHGSSRLGAVTYETPVFGDLLP